MVIVLDVRERIRVHLKDAKKFLEEALKEFEEGVRNNDVIRIRNSAERTWNAIVRSTKRSYPKARG